MTGISGRISAIAAAVVVAAGTAVVPASASPSVQSECAIVGVTTHHNDGGFKRQRQMYNGTDFNCPSNGWGYVGDSVTYWCYKPGRGGTYTFLTNWTRNARGWVPDVDLISNGSVFLCDN